MSFESLVVNNLKKYKVLAIIGVFVSFFVVVGLLNYFQRVTLEGFMSLQITNEKFTNYNNNNKNTNAGMKNTEPFGNCKKNN